MNEQVLLQQMVDWGYMPLAKAHPHSPGYSGLFVAIRPTPTRQHYDPETLTLRVREGDTANWVTFDYNSSQQEVWAVCPGLITICDRLDKRIVFFTFGGQLEVISDPGEILFELVSPAPVLELTANLESLPNQLADEVELMLSVFQAQWGMDDQGFARRLAELDPFDFYAACLESILRRYKRAPALRKNFHDLYAALCQEKAWLTETGQWPAGSLTLGQLFVVDKIPQ